MIKSMKILILLILCLPTSLVFAQTYYPVFDTTAVWDILEPTDPQGPSGQPPYLNHFKYRLQGDTLINSFTYQKLMRTNIDIYCSANTSTELYGFIRNNIELRQVFYRGINEVNETLLYNFNLQIGDTLTGSVFSTQVQNEYTVGAKDSILINNYYHKRYSINLRGFFFNKYLIEGVGTTVGLLEPVTEFWPFYDLICFSQNGQLGYISPLATECHLYTDTCYVGIEVKTDVSKVQVFPNPARDYLYVYMYNPQQGNPGWCFTLYDMTGHVLYTKQLVSSLMVDCSTYCRGLFYYRISSTLNLPEISGKILFQ